MLSLSKTEKLLGRAVDISRDEEEEDDVDSENGDVNELGITTKQQRQLLLKQAASFRDFERLFAALNALEAWRNVAAPFYE